MRAIAAINHNHFSRAHLRGGAHVAAGCNRRACPTWILVSKIHTTVFIGAPLTFQKEWEKTFTFSPRASRWGPSSSPNRNVCVFYDLKCVAMLTYLFWVKLMVCANPRSSVKVLVESNETKINIHTVVSITYIGQCNICWYDGWGSGDSCG